MTWRPTEDGLITLNGYGAFGSSLRDLPRLRTSQRHRASSWDRSGGNEDRIAVAPGQTVILADISGAGSVTHIWMTAALVTPNGPERMPPASLRALSLKMFWDGSEHPNVWVPLGDFFGIGHGQTSDFVSAPLQMSPQDGTGFNSFFHMPFAEAARIEVVSELDADSVLLYFYVDYERFDHLDLEIGRFHAQWQRQNPTLSETEGELENRELLFGGTNTTGAGNYVILEANGRGHYVGCILSIHNLRATDEWNWYGEGDDMIFIDGEPFPPRLHGTGTEDYFNTAWCPTERYNAPYHGITLPGGNNWSGRVSLYRFHVEDPVMFERSIRVTIEHGHANRRSDDMSSVAYWYQALPHTPFELPPVRDRIPREL